MRFFVRSVCEGHRLMIVDLSGNLRINDSNVEVIDFDAVCKKNKEYLGLEKGKLSDAGYEALAELLGQKLK